MAYHGGSRNGSGRRKGGQNQKTREIAVRATAEGITPLEVMLRAMRQAYEAGDLDKAAGHAKDAAPYCHPRQGQLSIKAEIEQTTHVVEFIVTSRDEADKALAALSAASGVPRL